MPRNDNTVIMESVRIIFKNFAGKEDAYNREGARNFAVLIDDQTAAELTADGWNVKWLQPREGEGAEEGETPQAYLPVALKFDGPYPPRVVLITSRGRSNLSEREVEMLDWADIINVDLIVRPYAWTVNGKSGLKAYVQSLYVEIEEDPLELKYANKETARD